MQQIGSARSRSRLRALNDVGQSVWYDNISRRLLDTGALASLIEDGVTGVTSNPTIFEKAVAESDEYDEQIGSMRDRGAGEIFEAMAVSDIRRAADLLRPVYDSTGGHDGFVSLEVSPTLANDSGGTIDEARRLWTKVDRPNLMVKVPATPAGMPAITTLIGEGINVNVTLIFALSAYRRAIDAFLAGLETRASNGLRLEGIASVASFFVSRVDTAVDRLLSARSQGASSELVASIGKLKGQAGIANAVSAYSLFAKELEGHRFHRLSKQGAQIQRPLWASTSTKDPSLPDTYYVSALAGPNTVDTIPPATLDAFKDHGEVSSRLKDFAWAEAILRELGGVGVDVDRVTAQLLVDGVDSFSRSFESLIERVETKRSVLSGSAR